ncbi:M9 family metallopeptidase [Aliikangiella coralliicola]|uniref:microbial collagenase n=1 Tax=Aliikangiella coralliicola TaxID=2592383 RepID=A0A545U7P6_9GAMM|nr:M9 family metallopeptidase [Aliikangiella coralliicola]TQV85489.1 collagenase [Aliikangiella coralliicola]
MKFNKKNIMLSISAAWLGVSTLSLAGPAPQSGIVKNTHSHHANHLTVSAPVEPKPDALKHSEKFLAHNHSAKTLSNKHSTLSSLVAPAAAAACDMDGYATKTGQALVDHILTQEESCINDLYTGNATSFAAFQPAKMITVANATASLASSYSATSGPNNINSLYYFLRTGYYIEFYFPDDVGPYGNDVQSAVRSSLDNLVNNADFYANSDQHGKNIQAAIILIDSAGENARYLPVVKEWLTRWNSSYASSWNMRSSVNGIFTVLFRGHNIDDFKSATSNDTQLMQKLGSFARSDWMLDSDALYLQENAAGELARFLQHDTAPVYQTVKTEVQGILDRYSMNGNGKSVWIRAATVVDYWGKCAEFNICGFKEQLEAQVLSLTHTCSSSLKMRAEEITAAQFNESCGILADQEVFFHQMLVTNNNPVADDLNTDLEMVIFNNSDSYSTHAGLFFGIDTNNGGMYLEGDPSKADNQARFIAYEAEWLLPDFHIWNLTHEYVHYLDGRFNLKGDFGDARTSTHKTVWWIEGLAEYISQKNLNDAAITLARTKEYSLSEIFSNDYNSGQDRVYRWGYLAVRFMFEKHPNEVNQILSYFRAGNYDAYLNYINSSIGTAYNSEWNAWLDVVESTTEGPTPPGGSNPQTELVNGQTVSGLATPADNGDLEFFIDVPADATDLKVEISGGSGDADLYVKVGSMPTDSSYDCRPYKGGNNELCEEATPQSGRWYVRLKAYSAYSGVNLTASFSEDGGSNPGITELAKGQAETNLTTTSNGDELMFFIDVPANASDLSFKISGGSGDADLYVRQGSEPTDSAYDCRPYIGGNNETCDIASPQEGRWYVRVKAYSAYSGVSLVADYTAATGGFDACTNSSTVNQGNVEDGSAVCVAARSGTSYFYTYVNAGTSSLVVELSGGTGNGDLYGNFATWATSSDYQFSSTQSGNSETMTMTNPPTGWVYFSVVANPEHGDTSLRVTHQ